MIDHADVRRRYGQVFDAFAEEYDRERFGPPDELIDAAVREAGLAPGDRVLEVGCGTGLLTEALAARGLVIEAIDPGAEMVRLARRRVGSSAAVDFTVGRFEETDVAPGRFAAVLSASAWHWLEPAVSWRRAHEALAPGGRLCVIQNCAASDPSTARDDELMLQAFQRAVPELAAGWPQRRDVATLEAGAAQRREDISAVWSWLGNYGLQDAAAARLFHDVRITTVPQVREQTADALEAYMRTTSFYARLAPGQRERLAHENRRAAGQLGGTFRWRELAVLVSGRRA